MPYIKKEARAELDTCKRSPETAGELNYAFTQLIIDYVRCAGLSYQAINDVVGALEGAKAEFQRRVAAPYEDKKIQENGDVYPADFVALNTPPSPPPDSHHLQSGENPR